MGRAGEDGAPKADVSMFSAWVLEIRKVSREYIQHMGVIEIIWFKLVLQRRRL